MRPIFPVVVLCLAGVDVSHAAFPLAFESHGSRYVARGAGFAWNIAADGAVLQWGRQSLRIATLGADPHAHLEGLGRMPGHVTYMLGTTSGDTYNLYGQVRCRSAYPGVDMVYHGNQDRLEYDFYVAPRASAGAIVLGFLGADGIDIDSSGDLILRVGTHVIRQPKPLAWQEAGGRRRPVAVAYRKLSGGRIGFRTGPHDARVPLVIDPVLVFDTLFGGTGGNTASALALDSQGNIYVAGATTSVNFATVTPVQGQLGTAPMLTSTDGGKTWTPETLGTAVSINTVVAAPTSPSTLYANSEQGVFQSTDDGATWKLAGNSGLPLPAVDISVDAGSASVLYACTYAGVYLSTDAANTWTASNTGIATETGSNNVPIEPGCDAIRANPATPGTVFDMAFPPAALYRSVDSGKTWTALNTGGSGIVVDLAFSGSSPNTIFAGQYLGTILLSTDGGNTWSALANQGVGSQNNNHSLVINPSNPSNLYLSSDIGVEESTDGGQNWPLVLPTNSQAPYSGVLAIDSSRVYAFDSRGLFLSADAGQTWTMATLPYAVMPESLYVAPDGSRILLGTQSAGDAFITKWDPTGTQILYSTYLGGSGGDAATGIVVDSTGSAYVVGYTASANFPVTAGAFQTSLADSHDAFVAKLSPDGSHLTYSTLFGGGSEVSTAIAIDAAGGAYITGSVNGGLPLTANAFQKAPGGGNCNVSSGGLNYGAAGDAFVAKISPDASALIYASYLGGSCADKGNGIYVNADGSAWVVGATFSPDFPVTANAMQPQFGGGFGDGFVARISPAGALAYSSYLGGPGYDEIDALTLDATGNLYLTGSSEGFSEPASPGAFQPTVHGGCLPNLFGPPIYVPQGNAFVLKLNSSASAVTGLTYLGNGIGSFMGCDADGTLIALDPSGAPWIAGTPSAAFQTISPFQNQTGLSFISKFSPDLTQLLFSTYFEAVGGLAVDSSGRAYVAGTAAPFGGSITAPAPGQAYVVKIDPTPAPISLDNVLSASPFAPLGWSVPPGEVTPGKVIRLAGQGIGPATQTPGIVAGGAISTAVAGVQVTFDGRPAPLLYVSSTVIECIAPFEIAGHAMTSVQVTYNNQQSDAMAVPVYPSSTEVLVVVNPDFTVNSPSNPAPAGSIVTLYVTGAGQTNPASVDGEVYGNPLPLPTGPVTVGTLPVTYAAAAYGLAAGILQVNFQAPAQTPTGDLVVTINGSNGYFALAVQ